MKNKWKFLSLVFAFATLCSGTALSVLPKTLKTVNNSFATTLNYVEIRSSKPAEAPVDAVALDTREKVVAFLKGDSMLTDNNETKVPSYGYLTNDITDFYYATNVYGSNTDFRQGATFNGNGHTITFAPQGTDWPSYSYKEYANNTFKNLQGNQIGTPNHNKNILAGGLFTACNDGVITNTKFVLNKSFNYAQRNKDNICSFGIVSGINRGTITNCSLEISTGINATIHKDEGVAETWYSWLMIMGGYAGINAGNIDGVSINHNGNLEANSKGWKNNGLGKGHTGAKINLGGVAGAMYGGVIKNILIQGNGKFSTLATFNDALHNIPSNVVYASMGYVVGTNNEGDTGDQYHCRNTFYSRDVGLGKIDNVFIDANIIMNTEERENGASCLGSSIINNNVKDAISGVVVGDTPDDRLTNVYVTHSSNGRAKNSTAYYTGEKNCTIVGINGSLIQTNPSSIHEKVKFVNDNIILKVSPSNDSKYFYEIKEGEEIYATYQTAGENKTNLGSANLERSVYTLNLKKYSDTIVRLISFIEGNLYKGNYTIDSSTQVYNGQIPTIPSRILVNGEPLYVNSINNNSNFKIEPKTPLSADVGNYVYEVKKLDDLKNYIYIDKEDSNKTLYLDNELDKRPIEGSVTITPKELTINYETIDLVFDNTNKIENGFNGIGTINGLIENENFDLSYKFYSNTDVEQSNPLNEIINVGDYILVPSISENDSGAKLTNYKFDPLSNKKDFQVKQRELAIKFDKEQNSQFSYNPNGTPISYSIVDALTNIDIFTLCPSITKDFLHSQIFYINNLNETSDIPFQDVGEYKAKVKLGLRDDYLEYQLDNNFKYNADKQTLNYSIIKANPEYGKVPLFESITYSKDKNLGEIELPINENGKWQWEDDSIIPTVTDSKNGVKYNLQFIPFDTKNYNALTFEVSLNILKADYEIITTEMQLKYSFTGNEIIVNSGAKTNVDDKEIVLNYSNNTLLDAKIYQVTIAAPETENYNAISKIVEITVTPVEVDLNVVLNTLYIGQNLSQEFVNKEKTYATFTKGDSTEVINIDGEFSVDWKSESFVEGYPLDEGLYDVVIKFIPSASEKYNVSNFKTTTINSQIEVKWLKVFFKNGSTGDIFDKATEKVKYGQNATGPQDESIFNILGFNYSYDKALLKNITKDTIITLQYIAINYNIKVHGLLRNIVSNTSFTDFVIESLTETINFDNPDKQFSLKRAYAINKIFIGYYIDKNCEKPLSKKQNLEEYVFEYSQLAEIDTSNEIINIYLLFEDYETLPLSVTSSKGEKFVYGETTTISYVLEKDSSHSYTHEWFKNSVSGTPYSKAETIEVKDVSSSATYICVITEKIGEQVVNKYQSSIDITITPAEIRAIVADEFIYTGQVQQVNVQFENDEGQDVINFETKILQNGIESEFLNAGEYTLKINMNDTNFNLVEDEIVIHMKKAVLTQDNIISSSLTKNTLFANEPLINAGLKIQVSFAGEMINGVVSWIDERTSRDLNEQELSYKWKFTNDNFEVYIGTQKVKTIPITITFLNVDGKDGYNELKTFYEGDVSPNNPVVKHYDFIGWFDNTYPENQITDFTNITDNLTVKAKFEPIQYVVTLDVDGGDLVGDNLNEFEKCENDNYSITFTIERTQGLDLSSLSVNKLGYKFINWLNEEGYLITNITPDDYNTTTIYAKFELDNPINVGITTDDEDIVVYGKTITLNANYTNIDTLQYSFEWRKDIIDSDIISQETSIVLTNVSDSGSYFLTVKVTDHEGQTKSTTVQSGQYTIQKATISANVSDIDITYDGTNLNEKILSFVQFNTDMSGIEKIIIFKELNNEDIEGSIIESVINAGEYSLEISFGENYNPLDIINFNVKQKEFTGNLIMPENQEEIENNKTIIYGEDELYNQKLKEIIEYNRNNNSDILEGDREFFSVVIYKKNIVENRFNKLDLSLNVNNIEGYSIVGNIDGPGEYKIVVTINNDNYLQKAPVEYSLIVLKKSLVYNNEDEYVEFTNRQVILPNKISGLINDDSIADELQYSYFTLEGEKLDNPPINAGKYKIEVSFNGNEFYNPVEKFLYNLEIKAVKVDLVWENLDNPVQKSEFVVKCYYLNVDGDKVYLDVIGGRIEPGEYSIHVENNDSNYLISELDSIKTITIADNNGIWTLTNIIIFAATGGVVLLFIILIPIIVHIVKKKKRKKQEVC